MGASFVLSGVTGSFILSILLDKYKCFLKSIRFICFGSLISAIGIYFTLKGGSLLLVCLNIGVLGFCLLPICSVGYSFCTEITYPISEPMSNGIMTFVSQVVGIIASIIATDLCKADPLYCVIMFMFIVLVACIFSLYLK